MHATPDIVLIVAGALLAVVFYFFFLRNNWVYRTRTHWIWHYRQHEMHPALNAFSYHAMVWRYFWIWNREWFEKRADR